MTHDSAIEAHVAKILAKHPQLGETEEQREQLRQSAVHYLHAKERREAVQANALARKGQRAIVRKPPPASKTPLARSMFGRT